MFSLLQHAFSQTILFLSCRNHGIAAYGRLFVALKEQNSAVCGGFFSAEIDAIGCVYSLPFGVLFLVKICWGFLSVHYIRLLGLPPPVLNTLFIERKG